MNRRKLLALLMALVLCLGLTPPDALAAGSDNGIAALRMTEGAAAVTLTADRDADLVVAVYDEDGTRMLGSGVAAVSAGDTAARVEITKTRLMTTTRRMSTSIP